MSVHGEMWLDDVISTSTFFCVGMHSTSTNSLDFIKYDMHKRFAKRSVTVVPDDKVTVDCSGVVWILLHTVSPIQANLRLLFLTIT